MTTPQTYKSLLSHERERRSSTAGRTLLQESESDRARLVFSSPFRRLQQKAQVYSLEDNAAVRSRLTHSLEVAHVGRFIVQLALAKLQPQASSLGIEGNESFIQNLVETACLMHDIGNPPFGHFGEAAISDWFGKKAEDVFTAAVSKPDSVAMETYHKHVRDFTYFDGNCQGLRIVTRLQWNKDEYGLNLTYSQLATYLKYVVSPSLVEKKSKLTRKAGYFETESSLISNMWTALGMMQHCRFPLTYLMEAADDIAYCISDIEDGIEKELVHEKDFFKWIYDQWQVKYPCGRDAIADRINVILKNALEKADIGIPIISFTNFRTELTTSLANFAADKYIERHRGILGGKEEPIFEGDGPHQYVLKLLKDFGFKYLYSSSAASNNEMAGFSIISGILEHYRLLLVCDRNTFKEICDGKNNRDQSGHLIMMQQRLFRRLPKKYIRAYEFATTDLSDSLVDATKEWIHRAHLITDYISGMTDNFALETFQLLSGINVGKPI